VRQAAEKESLMFVHDHYDILLVVLTDIYYLALWMADSMFRFDLEGWLGSQRRKFAWQRL
jgi:hypothetical protein